MQNRGLVKFFAILFALVSVYQLSFTFVSQGIEKDAKEFAKGNPEKEVKYLDSIGKEKVFSLGFTDFTYNEVKDKKINNCYSILIFIAKQLNGGIFKTSKYIIYLMINQFI